ncbi:MAG TPA: hypothetical protein VGQ56_06735 [Gemmatimonadaceae bacterium]|jgi:hypothetical protein|nr:hypothetical protein [Gemmatimonadaceae bacterium]
MRRIALLVCSIIGSAHVAWAQDSLPLANIDREIASRLTGIVDSARARGLPTAPIIAKISQGVLLHATPDRIVTAAQSVATRLDDARTALAPKPTAADIVAGGDALSVTGVTKTALEAVRSTSPSKPVAVPLGLLAQLVASGVPATRATKIVTELVKRGASNAQLVALGNDVNSDVGHGARANASLDVRLRGLTAVLAPIPQATASQPADISASGPKKP